MDSSVSFPLSESPQKHGKAPPPPIKPPHLPFRRISLPTAPSIAHRESVFSITSVDDSLPEDEDELSPNPRTTVVAAKGNSDLRSQKARPTSIESPRKRKRTRDSNARHSDNKLSAKRKHIIDEFCETEKAYVEGLDLIYTHFLTPLITSLETSEPLLNRSALTSIFSNFIDIWNLHKSFLSALTSLLDTTNPTALPNLSPLLLAHFPYLSLYTPFITSFPSTITSLTDLVTPPNAIRSNPHYNVRFANFLASQEADPRCGKLKLRDWLLTIVQRCPRYLLLLKDLIAHTEKEGPEHGQLTEVHALVSKITLSLNTSLYTHAQTLALLALQKATPNLPFQLISPGRNLIKRGSLVQLEKSDGPVEREFLLFSDCLIWLAPAETSSSSWSWGGSSTSSASQSSQNIPFAFSKARAMDITPMARSRSKSDAEMPTRTSNEDGEVVPPFSAPSSPTKVAYRRSHYYIGSPPPPPPSMAKRNPSTDDKWIYKGHTDLVDIEVVVGSALEDERRFEILSPGGSFAVYAATETERDEWTSEFRSAKQQLLISLNVTNPNSTLTSSASTNHVRRVLQALPYHPSDERVATLKTSSSVDLLMKDSAASPLSSKFGKFTGKKEKEKKGLPADRRRKVEHWVPPVWIPDSKTSSCMRCGRMFGWRRRRHHCRLCGRCVCAGCSGRTFFITEVSSKDELPSKSSRACDACYETIFPVVDPEEDKVKEMPQNLNDHQRRNSDTITSLSHLPSWLSMPTIPVQHQPQALMAIDLNSEHDISSYIGGGNRLEGDDKGHGRGRLRAKSHQRLRSYQQILVDFQEQARAGKQLDDQEEEGEGEGEEEEGVDEDDETIDAADDVISSSRAAAASPTRKENTARRSKRFSLPAVALNATSVTARTTTEMAAADPLPIPEDGAGSNSVDIIGNVPSPARFRRFSLVLAGRNSHHIEDGKILGGGGGGVGNKNGGEDGGDGGFGRGVAAAKLAELLKKTRPSVR